MAHFGDGRGSRAVYRDTDCRLLLAEVVIIGDLSQTTRVTQSVQRVYRSRRKKRRADFTASLCKSCSYFFPCNNH